MCFHFPVSFAAGAAKSSADFTDLKDLDAAKKAKFDAMISTGIFDGVSDTTFGLNDEMTFSDAGITGVTSENLYGIQGILQDYDYPLRAQPKNKSQIQTIVTETIYLTAINHYFAYGYGNEPDKEAFDLAGLVGVTDLNHSWYPHLPSIAIWRRSRRGLRWWRYGGCFRRFIKCWVH